jgi:hypothetical protein
MRATGSSSASRFFFGVLMGLMNSIFAVKRSGDEHYYQLRNHLKSHQYQIRLDDIK